MWLSSTGKGLVVWECVGDSIESKLKCLLRQSKHSSGSTFGRLTLKVLYSLALNEQAYCMLMSGFIILSLDPSFSMFSKWLLGGTWVDLPSWQWSLLGRNERHISGVWFLWVLLEFCCFTWLKLLYRVKRCGRSIYHHWPGHSRVQLLVACLPASSYLHTQLCVPVTNKHQVVLGAVVLGTVGRRCAERLWMV